MNVPTSVLTAPVPMIGTPLLAAPESVKPCVSIVIDLVGTGSEPLPVAKLAVMTIVELESAFPFAAVMAARNSASVLTK
ncbi:hypothetical protein ACWGTI_01945 [Mesorhizobium sp. ArgA1]